MYDSFSDMPNRPLPAVPQSEEEVRINLATVHINISKDDKNRPIFLVSMYLKRQSG